MDSRDSNNVINVNRNVSFINGPLGIDSSCYDHPQWPGSIHFIYAKERQTFAKRP